MSDPIPSRADQNPLRTNAPGNWFSSCSHWLAGRRDGFPALLWAAVVNVILFALFLAWATPVYETNDDQMMQMIAAGFHSGHPDAHLVFSNILVGWVLRFFFGTWPGHNWYLIYLLTVHFAAMTAVAFLVVSRGGGWLFTFLFAGFFLIVETRILLHPQFTTTAFLAGTAGVLLLVDGLRTGQPVNWWRTASGMAFAGLMCLVREPVAPLLILIASPFLLERLGLAGWRRMLGMGLVFASILAVLHVINREAYQRDPAWAEFSEYNRMRGEIHVTALTRYIPQAVSAAGWSENDGWMFKQFYFADPDVYAGVARMHRFLDKLKSLAQVGAPLSHRFSAGFLFLPELFWRDARIVMVLAMLNAVWCIMVAGIFRRRCLITLIVTYGICVALSFYLVTTARLPERVSYNIPLFFNAICLYWALCLCGRPITMTRFRGPGASPSRPWPAKILRMAALVLFPFWCLVYLSVLYDLHQSLQLANMRNQMLEQISRKIFQPLRTLPSAPTRPVLVTLPLDSVLEQCLFFYPSAEKLPFSVVPYGWITQSPIFDQTLERHHLHPYSLSLVDRPDIFFLMGKEWIEPLRTFYREHYGLDVRFDPVLNTDDMAQFEDCDLHIYQAHAVGGKIPAAATSDSLMKSK